jgi:hypothetical protein
MNWASADSILILFVNLKAKAIRIADGFFNFLSKRVEYRCLHRRGISFLWLHRNEYIGLQRNWLKDLDGNCISEELEIFSDTGFLRLFSGYCYNPIKMVI